VSEGRLEDKVALVTGGASGIGEAICRLFAGEGARGIGISDLDVERAEALAIELGDDCAMALKLDVSDETQWASAVAEMQARFGSVDILVNNAGRGGPLSRPKVENTTVEGWEVTFATNARGPMLGIKHVVPIMRQAGGGSIINIVSAYALIGDDFGTAYAASKGAVRALVKTAAVQYGPEQIRINGVYPGFVETPMTTELHGRPGVREKRIGLTLLGRLATAEDIAFGVLFLASDESRYMTGAELVIDGGVTAH
jgi:NAD(P)-dependent dehydrogenase (short-subunit alcohol dehydrogenase family)